MTKAKAWKRMWVETMSYDINTFAQVWKENKSLHSQVFFPTLGVRIPRIPKIWDKSEGNKLGLNSPPPLQYTIEKVLK
jgi:hypothetical protein